MVKRILVLVRKGRPSAVKAKEAKEPNRGVDVGRHQKQDNYSDEGANARAVFCQSKSINFRTTEGGKEVEGCQQQQNNSKASKKRPPLTKDANNNDTSEETKRQKGTQNHKHSTDVPPQAPIGCYENEEEADVDNARAFFKYRPKEDVIDLSDVPPQAPILRSEAGSSKYRGVYRKKNKKYQVLFTINRKNHSLGYYHDEEEAAVVYARAAFKYKSKEDVIDLPDVSPQPRTGTYY